MRLTTFTCWIVLDSNNYRVLVFDNAGKLVRRIGQRGAGPGELMVPTGLTVMVDGTLVVSDGGRHAYSLFGRAGNVSEECAVRRR
jgi:hypothetical protein